MTKYEAHRPTLAVYGANGHTGGYILTELRRRGLAPILVGRNADRLRAAAATAGLSDAQIRLADLDDPNALAAAFSGADAVISGLPAYIELGEPILTAAVAAGAHYVDIAGEQLFIKKVLDEYGPRAEAAGVTVLPGVSDTNLPADLIAELLAARLPGPVEFTISHHTRGGGAGSRGSAKTLLANQDWFRDGGWHFAEGELRTGPVRQAEMRYPGEEAPVPVAKFAFGAVLTIPRHIDTAAVAGVMRREFRDMVIGLTPELVAALPEKPRGTSDTGHDLVIDAVGADGRRLRGVLSGVDSYRDSGLIAVEAAVRLASGGAKAGVLVPAEAFDAADFLSSLARHDIGWKIEIQ